MAVLNVILAKKGLDSLGVKVGITRGTKSIYTMMYL